MKNKLILFLLISFIIPSNFLDRFRVPIYATTSVQVGYDSNIFRFSESDMADTYEDVSFMGDSEKFDSGMIKSGLEIEYSPALWDNHEIRFKLGYKNNYFSHSKEKAYDIITTELGVHLGSYQWLKMGYRYIPKFYLKEYRDLDLPGSPYLSCNFLSQSFFISYSIPFIGKGNSLKFKISQLEYLYNANFTEYDIQINQFASNLYLKVLKFNTVLSFSYADASDISDDDVYMTMQEQSRNGSYKEYKIGFSLNRKNKKYINRYGVSTSLAYREHEVTSDSATGEVVPFYYVNDPYNIDRTHLEINNSIWVEKKIGRKATVKLLLKQRNRKVDSPYQEIIDLKSFEKYEVLLSYMYDLDLDFLY